MPLRRRDTLPKNRRTSSAGGPSSASGRARRVSRKEKEAKQRRQLYWGLGAAGTLIIVILLVFSANQYWFRPRHVLASVNGTDIRRSDYWKVRSFDLINQVNTYSSYAQSTALTSNQQQQYASFAQSAANDLSKTWNSTSLDAGTLTTMVEDQVYLQNMDKLGLSKITDQEITDYITQLFQPSDAPLITATPTATLIPERAAWATQTAQAQTATAAAAAATPISNEATPVAENGTPVAEAATPVAGSGTPISGAATPVSPAGTPVAAATPPNGGATPVGSPVASPVADASATATVAPATPNPKQAQATVTATYKSFKDVSLKTAHMSESDFRRLIVMPALAREKVKAALDDKIGQSGEQVHAGHILVGTKDLADTIYQQLQQPGANFEQIAKDQSEDATTAPNGGDLGWIAKGQMVPEFEAVAFATDTGQISKPFQTKYGWHIVKIYAKDPNRAMTTDQLTAVQTQTLTTWVATEKASMKISSEAVPTATPATSTFSPPVGAPPTPTATTEAAASPVAEETSPVASPAVRDEASPVTGAGTPIASPVGSPSASPVS